MSQKTVNEYLDMIGERVKLYRVYSSFSQKDLEEMSGVSLRTISRFEQGESIQTESLIKILIALKLSENLELLVPDQSKRPSYYLEEQGKRNKRARKKKMTDNPFVWGDEKE